MFYRNNFSKTAAADPPIPITKQTNPSIKNGTIIRDTAIAIILETAIIGFQTGSLDNMLFLIPQKDYAVHHYSRTPGLENQKCRTGHQQHQQDADDAGKN